MTATFGNPSRVRGVVDAELGEKAIELFKEALGETNIEYSAEAMKNAQTPAILLVSEETRRVRRCTSATR